MRIIAFRIKGGTEAVMLATTLLHHWVAVAVELVALYHARRVIESTCDQVMTHVLDPGAALRSKTPDRSAKRSTGSCLLAAPFTASPAGLPTRPGRICETALLCLEICDV